MRARGVSPARILEPTCGSGAFLRAAAAQFPAATELLGIEYQHERFGAELTALQGVQPRLRIRYDNAYEVDFAALEWRGGGPLLVVGNPPWVTAAALGRSGRSVLQPPRANISGLRGLAAVTGAANFDVAEFLLLKLLRELGEQSPFVALLVKESVARKILTAAVRSALGVRTAEIVRIDARAWFGVAVDACCLLLSVGPQSELRSRVLVRGTFGGPPVGTFVPPAPPLPSVPAAIVFRQGIKHDAADVFELRRCAGAWHNGYGQTVDVEAAHLFPLRKARALHRGEIDDTALIVPHFRLGARTDGLAAQAPKLWRYLHSHAARIAARKSSIYRNAPAFAMFGIGPYSFAPWKVAVAGLYAEPRFRLIGPHEGRPVVLGDTAYFAAFENEAPARDFAARCAAPGVAAAIGARVVRGKRPITKALLDAIDWPSFERERATLPQSP